MKIRIQGNLYPKQIAILNGLKRFNIVRAGRRMGKTYLATYALLKFAITHPRSLSWFVALDISTCVELAMPEFERICPPELIKSKNKQTRTITLYNDAVISWKTAETADALRGRGVDFLVLEEAAFWKNLQQLWQDVLAPQLMGRGGRALFISSPNGSNYFRRLEAQALENINANPTKTEWAVFHGTIYDAGNITKEEIEQKHSITPDLTWRQEYLAEYVDEIGLVYWEFKPTQSVVDLNPPHNPMFTIRGLDWGLNDNTACAFIQPFENKTAYIFDEHVQNNLDPALQCRNILSKYQLPVRYSVLDKSCWNRSPDMTSVAKRFFANGIPVMPATGDLDGSIGDFKGLLAAGHILIHRRCANLIQAIESWQYGSHEPDILAAARYGIDSLVRKGCLMPPIRTHKPKTIQDLLRDEAEMQRRIERINRHRPADRDSLSFRVYDQ